MADSKENYTLDLEVKGLKCIKWASLEKKNSSLKPRTFLKSKGLKVGHSQDTKRETTNNC